MSLFFRCLGSHKVVELHFRFIFIRILCASYFNFKMFHFDQNMLPHGLLPCYRRKESVRRLYPGNSSLYYGARTGESGHFLLKGAKYNNIKSKHNPLTVNMSEGATATRYPWPAKECMWMTHHFNHCTCKPPCHTKIIQSRMQSSPWQQWMLSIL